MMGHYEAREIANEIRMLRGGRLKKASFLIVEGADKIFYESYVVEKQFCQVISADNKLEAIKVLAILEKGGFAGVIAIVDTDFDMLFGKLPQSDHLFFTDSHDLETMILQSPALEKFLSFHGEAKKVNNFENKYGKKVRDMLLDSGQRIGYFRWISLEENLHLSFGKLPFKNFISEETLEVVLEKLIKAVLGISKISQPVSPEELEQKIINKMKNNQYDLWHVCQGHDLVEILAVGMRERLASKKSRETHADQLEKDLKLAYEREWFTSTRLYSSLKNWEQHHSPFRIFSIIKE